MVGGTLIVVDLLLRLRSRGRAGWLTQRQFGGHLFAIPIWVVGGIVIAANVIKSFTEQA